VAYGHVGNSAAVFPLQRLGMEVWAVNTVQFSNHPGYGAWQGQTFTGEAIRALVDGIAARGVLPSCEAVLSGYLGDAATGEAVLHAVEAVRGANPASLYCCDPVIGDTAPGVYVRPGIPEFLRARCLPAADILTPNQFELEHLTGRAITSLAEAKTALACLRKIMRPDSVVLLTSLHTTETPDGAVDLLAADGAGAHRLRMPLLPLSANGAGDTIAALFLLHWLRTRNTASALSAAASAVFGLLRRTAEAGSRELLTVAAQQEFVAPSQIFQAEPC
jgi:pyridoxine kinase